MPRQMYKKQIALAVDMLGRQLMSGIFENGANPAKLKHYNVEDMCL